MPLDSSYNIGQTVGAKLRAARLKKKFTQGRLAQPEFSVSYISAIERGQIQPSLRALELLARRLDLSTSDLLPAYGEALGEQSTANESQALKEIEYEILLLEAQIAIHQGEPEQAVKMLGSPSMQQKEPQQSIAASYILGLAHLASKQIEESEQILAKAVKQAQEHEDPLYPRIMHLQSTVYGAMRNTARAIRLQSENLAYLEQCPSSRIDVFFLAQIHNSLGNYYDSQGEYEKALKQFQQALILLGDTTSYQRLKSIYGNLSQFHRERVALQCATFYDYKWCLADLQSQFATVRCDIEHALGHALLRGLPDEAHTCLNALLLESNKRSDRLAQASASIHLAAWFIGRGEYNQAEPYVCNAQTLASSFGDTVIIAEALLFQGEIAYTRQDYPYGDQCFLSGIAVLESLEAYEELEERLAKYAQLLEERGMIQKAIMYMRQAYEYRQRMS